MDNLEQQLASVMNNPAMMQQIMQLAQSMESAQPAPEQPYKPEQSENPLPFPDIDLSMIQKLSGFARQSGIDDKQKALLNALRPYLKGHRINKLERAMRAAKMAGFATTLIGR